MYDVLESIYFHDSDEDVSYERAFDCYNRCLVIRLKRLGKKNAQTAIAYTHRAGSTFSLNDFRHCISDANKALSIFRKLEGDNNDAMAFCYEYLGGAYRRLGGNKRSDECFKISDSIRCDVYPEGDERRDINTMMKWIIDHTAAVSKNGPNEHKKFPKSVIDKINSYFRNKLIY